MKIMSTTRLATMFFQLLLCYGEKETCLFSGFNYLVMFSLWVILYVDQFNKYIFLTFGDMLQFVSLSDLLIFVILTSSTIWLP